MRTWMISAVAIVLMLGAGTVATVTATDDIPDGIPPTAQCNMAAFVTSGTTPNAGDYLEIQGYSYSQNTSCDHTFTVVYTTGVRVSCSSAGLPGPSIATYAVAVGNVYEVTAVNGSCLTLCKCN